MRARLTVLASGSGGNASLLEVDGIGILIDIGLGPRQLAWRMNEVGASWKNIRAALLTHTHGDHWRERTLAHLMWQGIPLYCHIDHVRGLRKQCPELSEIHENSRLVRTYQAGEELALTGGVRCRPFELSHDGGPTFGFRFERSGDLFSPPWALGYAADLGTWDAVIAAQLCDVDVLALEFNHDVELQRTSGRSPWLISRVLGDEGHLSNAQAASLLRTVLRDSPLRRLRHLVQLHLSRDCNRPDLARLAAQEVFDHLAAEVALHTAHQDYSTIIPFWDAFTAGGDGESEDSSERMRRTG